MKVKTNELVRPALDWAVAIGAGLKPVTSPIRIYPDTPKEFITGYSVILDPPERDEFGITNFEPSVNWSQGGPIFEQEQMLVACYPHANEPWLASRTFQTGVHATGHTALIAVMRCFVASKLGSEVDVPGELL